MRQEWRDAVLLLTAAASLVAAVTGVMTMLGLAELRESVQTLTQAVIEHINASGLHPER